MAEKKINDDMKCDNMIRGHELICVVIINRDLLERQGEMVNLGRV